MNIEEKIGEVVANWLYSQGPRVRDENVSATIKFTICQARSDDDGMLCLELHVEETTENYFDETDGLRLYGVRFDIEDDAEAHS